LRKGRQIGDRRRPPARRRVLADVRHRTERPGRRRPRLYPARHWRRRGRRHAERPARDGSLAGRAAGAGGSAGGSLMRPALGAAALAVVAGLIGPGAALAQRSTCGPFRVEWNRGVLSPTSSKLEGFVYNDSPCSLANVRLMVVALDASGRATAQSGGWVFGNLPPRGRGYFALPLPSPAAVEYRVNVVSYDEVMSPQSP